ncbi:hypothetical protein B0H13DRAFT_2366815 [Mycena leptocephala]|nr:hypothetical protein B0H13DRAFT_2366815 [Mycena leptocephala]
MPPSTSPQLASNALVTGVVCSYLTAALAPAIAVALFTISNILNLLPEPLTLDLNVFQGLIPMVGLNILSLTLSNFTLKYVDASFYQVACGLVLPFTICVSGIVLHTQPSLRVLLPRVFSVAFSSTAPISLLGVSFGVASSSVAAIQHIHSVVIKKSLFVVNGSSTLLSWYTNLLSAVVLTPLVVISRRAECHVSIAYLYLGALVTGTVGFMMSLASLLSIKVTSPITHIHMVSAAVHGVAASF